MYAPDGHSITFVRVFKGCEIPLFPARPPCFVYLLCFAGQPLAHARHYSGATSNFPARLELHQQGRGAKLLAAVHDRDREVGTHTELHVARLWRFNTMEEARAFERRLKRRGHGPRHCPICMHRAPDPEAMRHNTGHYPFSRAVGKRRPMEGSRPRFQRLNACAWCWCEAHADGEPFPESLSSSICDRHAAQLEEQAAARRARRKLEVKR